MRSKLIKSLVLFLSVAMILTLIPVNAADFTINDISADSQDNSIEEIVYQNSDDEDFSNHTSVFAKVGSKYKVTIPKVIVLSGMSKKASYYVDVTGDIAAYETINVIPEKTVDLYSSNKTVQTGNVTQDKTAWTYSTLNTKANGQVEADGITAGKWSGIFFFNININRLAGDVVDINHTCTNFKLVSSTDATCTEPSTEEYVCVDCNFPKTEHATPALGHEPKVPEKENEIAATCTEAGSYDMVTRCSLCNKILASTSVEVQALGHDYKCSEGYALAELKQIAASGRAAEYDIKVGDHLNMYDTCQRCGQKDGLFEVEVTAIGSDYIECATTFRVVTETEPKIPSVVNGETINACPSSFYKYPQVNNGTTNSAKIGYIGSDIEQEVNNWFDSQPEYFKSIVKDTQRTYEVATLTYNTSTKIYTQKVNTVSGARETATKTMKAYIPTATEAQTILNRKTGVWNDFSFWSSTPNVNTSKPDNIRSFGRFKCYGVSLSEVNGYNPVGAVALFRIG